MRRGNESPPDFQARRCDRGQADLFRIPNISSMGWVTGSGIGPNRTPFIIFFLAWQYRLPEPHSSTTGCNRLPCVLPFADRGKHCLCSLQARSPVESTRTGTCISQTAVLTTQRA